MEGTLAVFEALDKHAAVQEVFVSEDHPDSATLAAEAAAAGASVVTASHGVLEALSETTTPQGVVAVLQMEDIVPSDMTVTSGLVLVLDQIRDPGNAGTLVRCATAAGADAVFFTQGSVDPYSPKTVRSAAGALFRMEFGHDLPFERIAEELSSRDFAIVGTDAAAEKPYDSLDCTGRIAFVVGNEAWGISEEHRPRLDELVSIPMPGDAESLNAGIAGAILLFEAVRQRRISSATK